MPPTTDNPTDRAREDGSDEDWARWEQTFRDARPVLPEIAMVRIEARMSREINRAAATPPLPRLKRRIFFLLLTLSGATAIAFWAITRAHWGSVSSKKDGAVAAVSQQDRYPLDVPIGPQLLAPDAPLIPLEKYRQSIAGSLVRPPVQLPTLQPLLEAAEKQCAVTNDGWHLLGLLELRRAAHVSDTLPVPITPNKEDFHIVAAWRMLPLEGQVPAEFREQLSLLRAGSDPGHAAFWQTLFDLAVERQSRPKQSTAKLQLPELPREFPSNTGERAQIDLLLEMGEPAAQAALMVLTNRSYHALTELEEIDGWLGDAALRARLREGYLSASHDLLVRVFALNLAGRKQEADALIAKAMNLPYLIDPRELAVLLARLGPDDAYDKLLRPLIENEVGFIENPPKFDESDRRSAPVATIEGTSKSVQEGVTNYNGNIKLSAGPWRLTCDKLAVFTNPRHGLLLTGTGNIQVRGVLGLFRATADEVTLNTETGELKLSGRVHLDGWTESRDMNSCTIIRTGEVRP